MAKPAPATARSLRELEKEGILAALAATNGNKAQAAAILEIDRSTLYKKLKDRDMGGERQGGSGGHAGLHDQKQSGSSQPASASPSRSSPATHDSSGRSLVT